MRRALGNGLGGVAAAVAALAALPGVVEAQAHAHAPGDAAAHSHVGAAVDCTTLASPPWTGLPAGDREQLSMLQQSLSHLSTPEAAMQAGFRPVLGNIPGMGIHYVSPLRTLNGIDVNEPDHLLFAPVDGEQRLVGAAYAFTDVVTTNVAVPFESDLAAWHDHPELAAGNQTLHMLHVWFVPSSHGPFAGLNFWLPFEGAGVQPPNACWLANEDDAERIRQVSFALAVTTAGANDPALLAIFPEARARRRAAAAAAVEERQAERADALAALDSAAKADDHHAWTAAADRYLATLTPLERTAVDRVLQRLTNAQMSTPEREAARAAGQR